MAPSFALFGAEAEQPSASDESTAEASPLNPLPSLPPIPRDGPAIPMSEQADSPTQSERERAPRAVDRASLVADINALRQDVARVRRALEAQDPGFVEAYGRELDQRQEDASERDQDRQIVADGEPLRSTRLGSNELTIQRYRLGDRPMPSTVSARISDERVERVYREMMYLIGQSVNDENVPPARRMVDFHIEDLPWEEALTRLLQQVGLGWHRQGPNAGQIVIYDLSSDDYQPSREVIQERAVAALRAAARSGSDAIAAEARYRIARHDAQRAEAQRRQAGGSDDSTWRALHYAAISGFADIITEFDTGSRANADALPWVRRAMLGIGASMEAVGMHREALAIYRNYIAKADRGDSELPQVMLAAAQAARVQNQRAIAGDTSDLDIASDLLRQLIENYGDDPRMVAIVSEARLELGRLYFQLGEYRAAREELLAHAAEAGQQLSHQIHFMIAQSDMALGRQQRTNGDGGQRSAEIHFSNAENRLEGLRQALFNHQTDPLLDGDLYRRALYALGTVKMLREEPDYVGALHVFLRARQRFPQSDLEGPLLINIARCYAEIHGSREHIAAMWTLLENDALLDDREVQFQLSEMLQDLQVQAGAYSGPIEDRVRFYLAQYHFRMAEQNPANGQSHYESALSLYQRVILAKPPQYLAQAARLGLARAALGAGDEARARTALREVLRDVSAHDRDKQVAAQILGDYYYQRGLYREAIEAYDGRPAR